MMLTQIRLAIFFTTAEGHHEGFEGQNEESKGQP